MKTSEFGIAMEIKDSRAKSFTTARLSATGISTYPGIKPASLAEAYEIQDAAIIGYPDRVSGWKVGGLPAEWTERLGTDRLAGPVFETNTVQNSTKVHDMPVFTQGFAAVEGEVVAVIGSDAALNKLDYSLEEAMDMVIAMHAGVEIASSPFAGINEHGPMVTISDFGNNHGLILGEEIVDWRDLALSDWRFETRINGECVGTGVPGTMPGGPLESVRFLLENVARRGRPVCAGMMILTGAVTGVHRAFAGDEAEVIFNDHEPIRCRLVPARPVIA